MRWKKKSQKELNEKCFLKIMGSLVVFEVIFTLRLTLYKVITRVRSSKENFFAFFLMAFNNLWTNLKVIVCVFQFQVNQMRIFHQKISNLKDSDITQTRNKEENSCISANRFPTKSSIYLFTFFVC